MKKKIALIFSLALTIFLAACGANTSREKEIINNYKVEPTMSETLKAKYNLDFANSAELSTKAISLGNNSASNADDYYSVYASKNIELLALPALLPENNTSSRHLAIISFF